MPQQWIANTTAPGVAADDRRRLDLVIYGATPMGGAFAVMPHWFRRSTITRWCRLERCGTEQTGHVPGARSKRCPGPMRARVRSWGTLECLRDLACAAPRRAARLPGSTCCVRQSSAQSAMLPWALPPAKSVQPRLKDLIDMEPCLARFCLQHAALMVLATGTKVYQSVTCCHPHVCDGATLPCQLSFAGQHHDCTGPHGG